MRISRTIWHNSLIDIILTYDLSEKFQLLALPIYWRKNHNNLLRGYTVLKTFSHLFLKLLLNLLVWLIIFRFQNPILLIRDHRYRNRYLHLVFSKMSKFVVILPLDHSIEDLSIKLLSSISCDWFLSLAMNSKRHLGQCFLLFLIKPYKKCPLHSPQVPCHSERSPSCSPDGGQDPRTRQSAFLNRFHPYW